MTPEVQRRLDQLELHHHGVARRIAREIDAPVQDAIAVRRERGQRDVAFVLGDRERSLDALGARRRTAAPCGSRARARRRSRSASARRTSRRTRGTAARAPRRARVKSRARWRERLGIAGLEHACIERAGADLGLDHDACVSPEAAPHSHHARRASSGRPGTPRAARKLEQVALVNVARAPPREDSAAAPQPPHDRPSARNASTRRA